MPLRRAGRDQTSEEGATERVAAGDVRAQLDRRSAQMALVADLSGAMLDEPLEELLSLAAETLVEGMGAETAHLLRLVEDEVSFRLRASAGWHHPPGPAVQVHADSRTPAGFALRRARPVIVDDFDRQTDFEPLPVFDPSAMRSVLAVRIPAEKSPYGVLSTHSPDPAAFSERDVDFARAVAHVIAEALAAERHRDHRRRMLEELHRVMSAREEVLSIISHDLRSPAAALKLTLELVRRAHVGSTPPIAPEQVTRAITKANSNLDRMMAMMDDLLAVNRREGDIFDIAWEEVDLREIVEEVVDDFSEPIARSGSEVTIEGPASLVDCWDAMRLQQIVSNLLSNAIKYGQGAPIAIAIEARDDLALLRVQDHGRGIAPQHQERIFDRFVRIDPQDDEMLEDSYGLGLWIVRRIVEAFDGDIEVDSQEGRGSTFVVCLPRRK
jgi:signal transduction histidine kinase